METSERDSLRSFHSPCVPASALRCEHQGTRREGREKKDNQILSETLRSLTKMASKRAPSHTSRTSPFLSSCVHKNQPALRLLPSIVIRLNSEVWSTWQSYVFDLREAVTKRDAQAAELPARRRHPNVCRRGRHSTVAGPRPGATGHAFRRR